MQNKKRNSCTSENKKPSGTKKIELTIKKTVKIFKTRKIYRVWVKESGFFSVSNPLNDLKPVLTIKEDHQL